MLTHGNTLIGIEDAVRKIDALSEHYGNRYINLSYDLRSGEIYANYHCSDIETYWNDFPRDLSVITIGCTNEPITAQQISDWINDAVMCHRRRRK